MKRTLDSGQVLLRRKRGLRNRLTRMSLLILAVALLVILVVFGLFENGEIREAIARRSELSAEIIARQLSTDLSSSKDLETDLTESLGLYLAADPGIQWAGVSRQGRPTMAVGEPIWPSEMKGRVVGSLRQTHRWQKGGLLHRFPIIVEGKAPAQLIIHIDNNEVHTRLLRRGLLVGGLLLISILLAWLFLRFFLQRALAPISSLAFTARRIAETGDYQLRATKYRDDEVGELAENFNRMLDTHVVQNRAIQTTHAELAKSRRLESLGLLAGGVAHDLNNILGPMLALPDLVAEDLPADSDSIELIDLIKQSGNRASVVIQDLLSLARRGNISLERLDLATVIDECLESPTMKARLEETPQVQVHRELSGGDVGWIDASAPHLVQCFLNLFVNAIEAMGERGGTLQVGLAREVITAEMQRPWGVEDGEHVIARITDTGPGMDPELLEKIFEPFFTTKSMGGHSGSGLGLAVVFGVVQDHDAILAVESGPGMGTTFEIYFPAQKPGESPHVVTLEEWQGTERILVVDDYQQQRDLTCVLLESAGYTAEGADNGHEAINILKDRPFDLIVLDMVMEEGFDGLDTLKVAKEMIPELACVIATGYSETERVAEAIRLGASECLAKPYTRMDLLRAVRESIDQKNRSMPAPERPQRIRPSSQAKDSRTRSRRA